MALRKALLLLPLAVAQQLHTRIDCWGNGTLGQTQPPSSLSDAFAVAAGSRHGCALALGREVACWGDNSQGQTSVPSSLDTPMVVSAGHEFSCAVNSVGSRGEVLCWGDDSAGQVSQVPSGLDALAVSAGGWHACARTRSREAVCWGSDSHGQLQVPSGLTDIKAVLAAWRFSCAVRALTVSEPVVCWGDDGGGQVSGVPSNLGFVHQVAGGSQHACARGTSVGSGSQEVAITCWGTASTGSGTLAVSGSGSATFVDAWGLQTCAIFEERNVVCGTDVNSQPAPASFEGAVGELGVGEDFACALSTAVTTTATPSFTTSTATTLPATTAFAATTEAAVTTDAVVTMDAVATTDAMATTDAAAATDATSLGMVTSTAVNVATSMGAASAGTVGAATSAGAATATTTAVSTAVTTAATSAAAGATTMGMGAATSIATTTTVGSEAGVTTSAAEGTAAVFMSAAPVAAGAQAGTTAFAAAAGTAITSLGEAATSAAPAAGLPSTTAIAAGDAAGAAAETSALPAGQSSAAAVLAGKGGSSGTTSTGTSSSSTTSSSTSSTETGTSTTRRGRLEDLFEAVEERAPALLAVLEADRGRDVATLEMPLGQAFAARTAKLPGAGSALLQVGALDFAVPREALAGLQLLQGEELVLLVAVFNVSDSEDLAGAESVVSVELQGLRGNSSRTFAVSGLARPIVVTLPTNSTTELRCAFWEEGEERWSWRGVSAAARNEEGAPLRCETTHLSLFGAVLQAFLATLGCSQISLLSLAALQGLSATAWYAHLGPVVLWSLLLLFLLLFLTAAWLDHRSVWRNDFFLSPRGGPFPVAVTAATDGAFGPVRSMTSVASSDAAPVASAATGGESMVTGFVSLVKYTLGNPPVREALQEVLAAWCAQILALKAACGELWRVCSLGGALPALSTATISSAKLVLTCRRALKSMALLSATKLAAASLGMKVELLTFLLEDRRVCEVLMTAQERRLFAPGGPPRDATFIREDCEQAWAELLEAAAQQVLQELGRQRRRSVLAMSGSLFLAGNPFASALLFDPFVDRKTRSFLFAVDQVLTLALTCLFFEGTGEVKLKPLVDGDLCSDSLLQERAGYKIGRFLAITVASALISTLPVLFLESLQTRSIRTVPYQGSPSSLRQLRVWRIQERLTYLLGTIFLVVALAFIQLFLANSNPEDHSNFLLGLFLVLLQDWLVIPLSAALSLPLVSKVLLCLVHRWSEAGEGEVLREQRVAFFQRTNAMLPLMNI